MGNPEYDEGIDAYLGDEVRVNKQDDGTVVSRVYECKGCDGMGGYDASKNCEVYDDWQPCDVCQGTGEIEIE